MEIFSYANNIAEEQLLEKNSEVIPIKDELNYILLNTTSLSIDCCSIVIFYITSYTQSLIDKLISTVNLGFGKYKDYIIGYENLGLRRFDIPHYSVNCNVMKIKNLNGDFLLLKVKTREFGLYSILCLSNHLVVNRHYVIYYVKENILVALLYVPLDSQ